MLKLKFQYFGHLMRRTNWKKPWCWERLKARGEGDDRGWDGWMASPTRWTWFWVNSGSWWWTGRPGMLRSMGSQRVGHGWATELNWEPFTGQGRRDYGDLMPSQIARTHSQHLHSDFPLSVKSTVIDLLQFSPLFPSPLTLFSFSSWFYHHLTY